MAKESKKSPKEASNLFHNIMKASVSNRQKSYTMTKEELNKLRKDVDKKFAKFATSVETDNTGGISTSKSQYLAALTAWEDGWRKHLAERHRQANNKK